jgi:crotonobetainyl-CoA:carnitine CoA-transferase CaiB-like acyl-CoA transferase
MRVLDWTIWQQGSAAGAMLGDLGAEVIKVEDRETGDPARAMYTVNGLDVSGPGNAYFEVNKEQDRVS